MDFEALHRKSEAESQENMRRAYHNALCKDVEKLQPYENGAFLDFINAVSHMLREEVAEEK